MGSPGRIVKVRLLYEYLPVFSGPLDVLCGSLVDPGVDVGPLCGLWGPGAIPHGVICMSIMSMIMYTLLIGIPRLGDIYTYL